MTLQELVVGTSVPLRQNRLSPPVQQVKGLIVVLQISSLTKFYGEQPALQGVGFSLRTGEVLGLIGPNGAGKTTLLEAVAGLLPVDSGEVRFNDRRVPPLYS